MKKAYILRQADQAFQNTLNISEIGRLADIFVSYSKRNTPDDDEKAMMIWQCIGNAKNPDNIVAFHASTATCGIRIMEEICQIMNRDRTNIKKAIKALNHL